MLVLAKCFAAYEVLLLYWFYLERYVKDRSMLISNQEWHGGAYDMSEL